MKIGLSPERRNFVKLLLKHPAGLFLFLLKAGKFTLIATARKAVVFLRIKCRAIKVNTVTNPGVASAVNEKVYGYKGRLVLTGLPEIDFTPQTDADFTKIT